MSSYLYLICALYIYMSCFQIKKELGLWWLNEFSCGKKILLHLMHYIEMLNHEAHSTYFFLLSSYKKAMAGLDIYVLPSKSPFFFLKIQLNCEFHEQVSVHQFYVTLKLGNVRTNFIKISCRYICLLVQVTNFHVGSW